MTPRTPVVPGYKSLSERVVRLWKQRPLKGRIEPSSGSIVLDQSRRDARFLQPKLSPSHWANNLAMLMAFPDDQSCDIMADEETPDRRLPLPYHLAIRDYLKNEESQIWGWYASNCVRAEQAEAIRFDLLKSTYRIDREAQPTVI